MRAVAGAACFLLEGIALSHRSPTAEVAAWNTRRPRSSNAARACSPASPSFRSSRSFLLVSDARFNYLQLLRQSIATVVYPVQRLASMPGELTGRVGEFFVTQSRLQRENDQLKRQELLQQRGLAGAEIPGEREPAPARSCSAMRERIPRDFIAAEILYAHRDPFTRRVVVDKGIAARRAGGLGSGRRQRRGRPGDARVPVGCRR